MKAHAIILFSILFLLANLLFSIDLSIENINTQNIERGLK